MQNKLPKWNHTFDLYFIDIIISYNNYIYMFHAKSNGKFARRAYTMLNANLQNTALDISGNGWITLK